MHWTHNISCITDNKNSRFHTQKGFSFWGFTSDPHRGSAPGPIGGLPSPDLTFVPWRNFLAMPLLGHILLMSEACCNTFQFSSIIYTDMLKNQRKIASNNSKQVAKHRTIVLNYARMYPISDSCSDFQNPQTWALILGAPRTSVYATV